MLLHPEPHWNIMIGMIKKIKNIMKRTSPIWVFAGLVCFFIDRAGDDVIFLHRAKVGLSEKNFFQKSQQIAQRLHKGDRVTKKCVLVGWNKVIKI